MDYAESARCLSNSLRTADPVGITLTETET